MLKLNYICIFFFITSITAVISAYLLEYIFNFIPCKLCIYERIPYLIVLFLSLVYYIKPNKYVLYIMYTLYLLNIIISIYHLGLERTWFYDILGCTERLTFVENFEDIKNNLLNKKVLPSCSKKDIVFFGLSLVECNVIYCMISLVIITYYFNKGKVAYGKYKI